MNGSGHEAKRSETDTLRIGIVGFGGSGSRHALAFSNLPGVTVTAMVDPTQDATFAASINAQLYRADERFLEERQFEALFVATPDAPEPLDAVKIQWGQLMMDYPPIDALWERPIGLDEEEWSIIVASGRSSKFAANYFLRFGVYSQVLSAIDRGEIDLGEVHSVRIIDALNDGLDHKFWRFNPKVQLPIIFLDHIFDLISYLRLPSLRTVRAHRREGEFGGKRTDIAWDIQLEFENGAPGFLSANQYSGPSEHLRPFSLFDIHGEGGYLRVTADGARFVSKSGDLIEIKPEPSLPVSDAVSAVQEFITADQGVPRMSAAFESVSLAENAWHFVRWVRDEVEQFPLASADDALRALRIGRSIIDSANTGETVSLLQ